MTGKQLTIKNLRILALAFCLVFVGGGMLAACSEQEQGSAEKTGEKIDNAVEEAGEAMNNAAEETGEVIDEAAEATSDAWDEATD